MSSDRRLALFVVLLYTALLSGWYVAYLLIGDGFWLLGLVNAFAVYLFTPLPLIIGLAALVRQRLAWLVVIPVCIFLVLFGPDLLPPSLVASAGAGEPALTVMTYNVLYTVTDAAPIAASINRAGADIIAFQELTPYVARRLEHQIGELYPYRTPMYSDCVAQVAIWSRYPLTVEGSGEKDVLCRVMSVRVSFAGQEIRVIGMHAWPFTEIDPAHVEQSFRWREEQLAGVLGMVEGKPEPLILLGDLNSTPLHEVYRTLATHFTDAFREGGWGLGHTFPATPGRFWGIPYPARLVRIDHIFHSDHWWAESAWVGEWDGCSDHLPVVARLRLLALEQP
ncbi:MAG: endonuclease/exonuclease/phosphatase family protein [Anaerolineae bacterium]|nr:endonuclease/exonuclease/phosphatase family protein [Anaerolineae bacterium]